MNHTNCFAPLKERAGELPAFLRQLVLQQPAWTKHHAFDCVPIDNSWIQKEPALRALHAVNPIMQLGLLQIAASTMYDWHVDGPRLACVNMLVSEGHRSHTLFGVQVDAVNKEICELRYEPGTYYLFNNQQQHCVVNLDGPRHLLSLYFRQERPFGELLQLLQDVELVEAA